LILSVCNLTLKGIIVRGSNGKVLLASIKVTDTGIAEINKTIRDTGLEIPNQIFTCPEEVLDFKCFNSDLAPYIEDIFLNKFETVMYIHLVDARNIYVFIFGIY
jgi:hypothetical protein